MGETGRRSAADDATYLLEAYLQERVLPHPLLSPFVPEAAACVTGSLAIGIWDEEAPLDVHLVLPDEEHARLSASLRSAHLWDPARDFRLRLEDREPFRRLPGVHITILSAAQLAREFQFELSIALWTYSHAVVAQDPLGTLEAHRHLARDRFSSRLNELRCEHYYCFRQARHDMCARLAPRRVSTLLAIKRGAAAQEALRLAFLADGKPYPYDKWLEQMAERETECGPNIVAAVRAVLAAREPDVLDHAGKVLRDRVAFALLQGGVNEAWLEQWWLWPLIAPEASREC
jgi:hypothetical protein